jgi:phenylacetic acid degradation operon negative regulatory protein
MTSIRNIPGADPSKLTNRSLTARSVVASTLLGTHPPVLPARVLVRSGSMFGISEGTIRVALTRMTNAGELSTNGTGRYELIGHLRNRQSRQDESRSGVADTANGKRWNGEWEMAAVVGEGRTAAERTELRTAMRRLRYGELREGFWLRPANLSAGRLTLDRAVATQWTLPLSGRPDDPKSVARQLWDLAAWAKLSGELLDQLHLGLTDLRKPRLKLGAPESLAQWFTTNASVLRHLQADPLLPTALLPPDWPGHKLRETFETFDTAFLERWRAWLSA